MYKYRQAILEPKRGSTKNENVITKWKNIFEKFEIFYPYPGTLS